MPTPGSKAYSKTFQFLGGTIQRIVHRSSDRYELHVSIPWWYNSEFETGDLNSVVTGFQFLGGTIQRGSRPSC